MSSENSSSTRGGAAAQPEDPANFGVCNPDMSPWLERPLPGPSPRTAADVVPWKVCRSSVGF